MTPFSIVGQVSVQGVCSAAQVRTSRPRACETKAKDFESKILLRQACQWINLAFRICGRINSLKDIPIYRQRSQVCM